MQQRPDAATTRAHRRIGRRHGAKMPVPKRKTGKAVRDSRRAHDHLTAPARSECPTCHQPKLPHTVCPSCGSYKGKEVVETD
jgi:large subunit ribosomal protein L32